MDGNKNLEEDIIGSFKEEDIFSEIKDIYYHEDYDINCTIIQSLSILLVNIVKSRAFLYFILSKNFINDLLLIDYSKYDDEYYSYYVNFLKSLAMRLDKDTFILFYNKRSNIFPLLSCLNYYYENLPNLSLFDYAVNEKEKMMIRNDYYLMNLFYVYYYYYLLYLFLLLRLSQLKLNLI